MAMKLPRKLLQIAENFLKEGTNYFLGIEACNEVLDGHSRDIGITLMHEGLCTHAALFPKRKWKNDVHMATRDCNKARKHDKSSFKALYLMSEALLLLKKTRKMDHPSFNLETSISENSCANGSCGSPTSSQNDRTAYQPEPAIDMRQRYVGHCNVGTDIKHANFLGQKGEYIGSGSDDGRWFIWEKKTGRLIKTLVGDGAVVNCVQSHPFDFAVATSGIDNTIKIWTPSASVPSMVAGGAAGPEPADVIDFMESNQRRLSRNRGAVLPIELLERFRMQEFNEGT